MLTFIEINATFPAHLFIKGYGTVKVKGNTVRTSADPADPTTARLRITGSIPQPRLMQALGHVCKALGLPRDQIAYGEVALGVTVATERLPSIRKRTEAYAAALN